MLENLITLLRTKAEAFEQHAAKDLVAAEGEIKTVAEKVGTELETLLSKLSEL
jgi:DNA-binding NtrC family response regulator